MVDCRFCSKSFDSKQEMHLHWADHEDELNSHQRDKLKRARKKRESRREAEQGGKKNRYKTLGYALGVIAGIVLIGFIGAQTGIISFTTDAEPVTQGGDGMGEQYSIIGKNHIPEGSTVDNYNSNPPSSGDHYGTPANWGFYAEPIPDERVVHNLEHGGMWIAYTNVSEETIDRVKSFAQANSQAVIATPRPANDANIAFVAWGRVMKLDTFNETVAEEFLLANLNNAPEPIATATQHQ